MAFSHTICSYKHINFPFVAKLKFGIGEDGKIAEVQAF